MDLGQVLAKHHDCPNIIAAQNDALVTECTAKTTGVQACLISMQHGAVWRSMAVGMLLRRLTDNGSRLRRCRLWGGGSVARILGSQGGIVAGRRAWRVQLAGVHVDTVEALERVLDRRWVAGAHAVLVRLLLLLPLHCLCWRGTLRNMTRALSGVVLLSIISWQQHTSGQLSAASALLPAAQSRINRRVQMQLCVRLQTYILRYFNVFVIADILIRMDPDVTS